MHSQALHFVGVLLQAATLGLQSDRKMGMQDKRGSVQWKSIVAKDDAPAKTTVSKRRTVHKV
jgi:hypothetical protein